MGLACCCIRLKQQPGTIGKPLLIKRLIPVTRLAYPRLAVLTENTIYDASSVN